PFALQPLAAHRKRLLSISGLYHRNSLAGEGHYVKTTALLSGAEVHRTGGRDIRCGQTIDQLIAQRHGRATPLPSLELSTEPIRAVVDMGYSTVYGGHISWRSPTQPATREVDPRRAFDRLFRANRIGAGDLDRSVLDLVRSEAGSLARRLSRRDRGKLSEYLDSVRELERHLEAFDDRTPPASVPEAFEFAHPQDHEARVDFLLDLMVTAFRTDTTRVASLMFGNAVSGRNFSFLDGVKGGHHELSHHENKAEKQQQYGLIVRWHVERFARFLDRLAALEEEDQTLADRTCALFASGIRDGNSHDPHDLPILLAGGALSRPGKLQLPRHSPLCGLYIDLLHWFGDQDERFGDADRRLGALQDRRSG
ncbi:MAG: DUF1552 domain-containing protein, partial [Planctomycetes bacterium]|nr:DUF1552 domain-containing protein [Planctomycetota bacterium]